MKRKLTGKVDSGKRTKHALQEIAKIDRKIDDLSTVSVGVEVDGDVEVVRDRCGRDEECQTLCPGK